MDSQDKLQAKVSLSTMITTPLATKEDARARGTYIATMVGPREMHRDDYIRTRDELSSLTATTFKWIANFKRIAYLQEKLANFELVQQWADIAPNLVTTAGKNLALDTFLSGSSYSVIGPYMGLISSVSYTAIAAGDTMGGLATTNGWREAGNTNAPTYSGTRKTAAWSSASAGSKALSAALSFSMTGSGTVKGCFLVYGTGAVSTVESTAGTLYSAGLFSGGDQPVVNGNTLNVSYTASL